MSLITDLTEPILTTCRRSDILARISVLRSLRSGWLRRNLTLSWMSLRRVRIIICWNTCLLSTHTRALVTTVNSKAENQTWWNLPAKHPQLGSGCRFQQWDRKSDNVTSLFSPYTQALVTTVKNKEGNWTQLNLWTWTNLKVSYLSMRVIPFLL